ncbi:MAG TPA: hypothetical protein VMZ90_10995 [Vicinamibacterales bacterium]|nr:hypothetical protein [Vicinamibacterales bacterium]
MRGAVLEGPLDMLLLAALRDGATHGYTIIERLRTQRVGDRQAGSDDLPVLSPYTYGGWCDTMHGQSISERT